MRSVLVLCAVMFGLYWADQTYYAGYHIREADRMLQQILASFR